MKMEMKMKMKMKMKSLFFFLCMIIIKYSEKEEYFNGTIRRKFNIRRKERKKERKEILMAQKKKGDLRDPPQLSYFIFF
jgi:hypothetical protein